MSKQWQNLYYNSSKGDPYRIAREMAMNNDQPFHLAALLWRGKNKLIRIGINSARGRREWVRFYSGVTTNSDRAYCSHAEMDAIQDARPGDVLEVIRWTKDGQVTMAKPCVHCRNRIKRLGLKVRFTNYSGEWEML